MISWHFGRKIKYDDHYNLKNLTLISFTEDSRRLQNPNTGLRNLGDFNNPTVLTVFILLQNNNNKSIGKKKIQKHS